MHARSPMFDTFLRLAALAVTSHGLVAQSAVTSPRDTVRVHVRGRVVDSTYRPIPGVTIEHGWLHDVGVSDTNEAAHTTDAQGKFDFEFERDLETARTSRFGLAFSAAGMATVRWGVYLASDLGPRVADLRESYDVPDIVLTEGRELRGCVVTRRGRGSEQGRGISGATVRAIPAFSIHTHSPVAPAETCVTSTNAEGRFVLSGASKGPTTLIISADGYFDAIERDLSSDRPQDGLEVQLTESGYFRGRLVDAEGNGIQGTACVDYQGYTPSVTWDYRSRRLTFESHHPCQVVSTGADGRFAVPRRYPGLARIEGRGPRIWHRAKDAGLRSEPCDGIELRLPEEANRTLELRATDETGGELESFIAVAYWAKQPPQELTRHHLLTASRYESSIARDKVAHVAAPPADHGNLGAILVQADGFAPAFLPNVDAERAFPLTVHLVRESTIEGVVEGTNRAGITVECREARDVQPGMPRLRLRCTTDEHGHFRFDGMWAGNFELRAALDPVWNDESETVTVTLAASCHQNDVKLRAPTTTPVRGRVVWHGEPPRDCYLDLAQPLPDRPDYVRSLARAPLSADGRFDVSARPLGNYRLRLCGAGSRNPWQGTPTLQLAELDVREGASEFEVTAPATLFVTLRGVFRASSSSEIPRNRFLIGVQKILPKKPGDVLSMLGRRSLTGVAWSGRASMLPSDDGSFAFRFEPGEYQLEVIDAVTGIVLQRSKTIEVSEDTSLDEPLTVELEAVRLVLRGPSGRADCTMLGVSLPRLDAASGEVPVQMPWASESRSTHAIWVGDHPGQLRLFLPPGPVTLVATSSVSMFALFQADRAPMSTIPSLLGKLEFEVKRGENNSVLFQMEGTANLEGLDRFVVDGKR